MFSSTEFANRIWKVLNLSSLICGVFVSAMLFEKNVVIVISPLTNLMKDQVSRINLLGSRSSILGRSS